MVKKNINNAATRVARKKFYNFKYYYTIRLRLVEIFEIFKIQNMFTFQ